MEEIRVITNGNELRADGAKAFMDYINPLIEEKTFILLDSPAILEDEEKWLENSARELDFGNVIKVLLLSGGEVCGICEARKGRLKERNNVSFGLSVSKEHRRKGYGEKLMRAAIAEARKSMKPHRMWIDYLGGNEPARKLYEKLGFVEVARLKAGLLQILPLDHMP